MKIFSAVEIVDIGIEKEKKRKDFYARVCERFDRQDIKDLFAKLRDWEQNHIEKFTQIREGLAELDLVESHPEELSGYMQALVDDKSHSDVGTEEFVVKIKTAEDAINYAIVFEKDAILFFNEMIPYVPAKNRGVIGQLVNEEKQHIIYLSDLRKKIQ
ncbi:MAG: ferritin family protein [Candidatus Omnitrophota bacterium]